MIALIHGTLVEKDRGRVVVDAGGIGYEVHVSQVTADGLGEVGTDVTLRTFMEVRRDGMELYGFCDRAELAVFKLLIGVPRVGPGLALKVLSSLDPRTIVGSILRKDATVIARVPGIGEDAADRILADIGRKLKKGGLPEGLGTEGAQGRCVTTLTRPAREALRNLGYRPVEIDAALEHVLAGVGTEAGLEEVVRGALAYFARPSRA